MMVVTEQMLFVLCTTHFIARVSASMSDASPIQRSCHGCGHTTTGNSGYDLMQASVLCAGTGIALQAILSFPK